jgi:hypothetical protein
MRLRSALILGAVTLAVVWASSSSRSDPQPTSTSATPANASDEPISGVASIPTPGSESPMRDPFTPYDIGPAQAAWGYTSLTSSEKAVVDHGRDVTGWSGVHDAYRQAAIERATQAAAQAAVHELGIDDLGTTGVVP